MLDKSARACYNVITKREIKEIKKCTTSTTAETMKP
jgi:hypothetical protein